MTQDDAEFINRLRKSESARWLTAQWLSRLGYPVWLQPLRIRPNPELRELYADGGDVHITMVVEVKHRELDFTSREDFPFADVIVCRCSSFDLMKPKPYAYVSVNRAKTHVAVIKACTHKHWTSRMVRDSGFQNEKSQNYMGYYAPLDIVTFLPYGAEEDFLARS